MSLLLFLACATGTPAGLTLTGLDGAVVDATGWWIREHLTWEEDASRSETLHVFALTSGADACAEWEIAEPEPVVATGDARADCEAERDWYAAMSTAQGAQGAAGATALWFNLWDQDGGENEPIDGTFTPLDGPDADTLEWAGGGTQVRYDWYAEVASGLDCDAAASGGDEWAGIPSDTLAVVDYELPAGTLDFSVGEDELVVGFTGVEIQATDRRASGEDGTLDGTAVFEACDVDRVIEATDPIE